MTLSAEVEDGQESQSWVPVGWRSGEVYDWLDKRLAQRKDGEPAKFERGPDRIMRYPEVADTVGLKRSSIDRLESEGNFPRRIKLGKGS